MSSLVHVLVNNQDFTVENTGTCLCNKISPHSIIGWSFILQKQMSVVEKQQQVAISISLLIMS